MDRCVIGFCHCSFALTLDDMRCDSSVRTMSSTAKHFTQSDDPLMHDDSDEEEFIYPGEPLHVDEAPNDTTEEVQEPQHEGPDADLEGEPHEEEFVYPGASPAESTPETTPPQLKEEPLLELGPEPGPSTLPTPPVSQPMPIQEQVTPPKAQPSPAQLEALHSAAASGDLRALQTRFKEIRKAGDFEPFALANDASPRTGLTALHAASSRGHLRIVKWRTWSPGHLFTYD